jgi:thiol-disulfide isomerase/thioredoxin
MSSDQAGRTPKTGPSSSRTAVLVAALSISAGFAAVYVTLGGPDNARPAIVASSPTGAPGMTAPATTATQTGEPANAAPSAGVAQPRLNAGEVAGFVFKKQPEPLDTVAFVDGKGQSRTLADWKGRVVLLNLWATWCAPCRKEMPGLARLQKTLGSDKFEVVALAVDRAGLDAAAKYLGSIDAKDLALYVDATARAVAPLKAVGMPTTLLIDREGREIGRLTGPAEWDSADAQRLIQAHIR